MSFEIRDLMVKLSPAEDAVDPGGITCGICQTTSRTGADPLQCRTQASEEPGEEDEPLDAPEYDDPSERGAAPSRGVALALLRRQLQQALSQTAH